MNEVVDWHRFCEELHDRMLVAGQEVLNSNDDDLDKVEGLRVLLRDMRMAIDYHVEVFDPDFSHFHEMIRETYHLVGDTADFTIPDAFVDGSGTYRIRGNVGLADDITFTTQGPDTPGPRRPEGSFLVHEADRADGGPPAPPVVTTGALDRKDLELDPDGTFEIIASSEAPASGVWLRMTPQTNRILVRNIFHAEFRQHLRYGAALLNIERLDRAEEFPPPYSLPVLAEGLDRTVGEAGRTMPGRTATFNGIRSHGAGRFNHDQAFFVAHGRNPRTVYLPAYWSLDEGEAMVIESSGPLPGSSYWVLAAQNRWMESMDFRFFPTYVSKFTAAYEPDGGVRIVVSAEDPGTPNWISTCGHRHGTLFWRWNDLDRAPDEPKVTITTSEHLALA